MTVEKFEDLLVWQKARDLVLSLYRAFSGCKDFNFKNQIESAGISVMNNIAEGFERRGDKELTRFLFISKGSSGEVRSMLYIAQTLQYITPTDFSHLYEETLIVSKMLSSFIKSL